MANFDVEGFVSPRVESFAAGVESLDAQLLRLQSGATVYGKGIIYTGDREACKAWAIHSALYGLIVAGDDLLIVDSGAITITTTP
jgi:hypothetical protein